MDTKRNVGGVVFLGDVVRVTIPRDRSHPIDREVDLLLEASAEG